MMQLIFQSLKPALEEARTVAPAELPKFLGDLREVECTALARLSAPTPAAQPDEMLTVQQACAVLKCSRDFLYKNNLPFTRRLGRKLLFSRNGITEYLDKHSR